MTRVPHHCKVTFYSPQIDASATKATAGKVEAIFTCKID